jgi:hypothetical protein
MPGTDLTELRALLDIETGKMLEPADRDEILVEGLTTFNANIPRPFEIVDEMTVDRDMTDREKRAYVLWCAVMFFDMESTRWSLRAVKHRNAAGSTDMTGVEFALAKRRKELFEQQLTPILQELRSEAVVSETKVQELGETLEFAQNQYARTAMDRLDP